MWLGLTSVIGVRCTEVRFANFLSSGFTTMAVINPQKRKLTKPISERCGIYTSSVKNKNCGHASEIHVEY